MRSAVHVVAAGSHDPADPWRGLYVDDAEALRLGARAPALELEQRFDAVCARLALDPLERQVLALCLAPETHADAARLFGYLHDDLTRCHASPRLVARLLASDDVREADVLACFGERATLRVTGAIRIDASGPVGDRAVTVGARLACEVVGAELGDVTAGGRCAGTTSPGCRSAASPPCAASACCSTAIAGCRSRSAVPTPSTCSPPRAGARSSCSTRAPRSSRSAATTSRSPWRWTATSPWSTRSASSSRTAGSARCEDRRAAVPAGPAHRRARGLGGACRARGHRGRRARAHGRGGGGGLAGCDGTRSKQRRRRRRSLPARPPPDRRGGGARPCRGGRARGAADVDAGVTRRELLALAARTVSSSRVSELAELLGPGPGWDSLVLPPRQLSGLRSLSSYLCNREQVVSGWGYDSITAGRGLTAMFAGESGTGKTLAARVVAGTAGLDVYRVDLAALFSKWVGETEKNLDRIFTAAAGSNAVLFFDEADVVFSKRSAISGASDRYANLETAYLLQRIEGYDGIVVLATNLRSNIDDAFLRRIDVFVDFPAPEAATRRRLWEALLPAAAPRADDVDLDFLAERFELTGGGIRNCTVSAAFLAAGEGAPIGMTHLVRAVALEYAKLGRLTLEADFERYHGLVREP